MGSGFGHALGLDHTAVRNAEGLPYIPASLLKGCLRGICKRIGLTLADSETAYKGICETLAGAEQCRQDDQQKCCVVCRLFGSRLYPGRLRFTDGLLPEGLRAELLLRQRLWPGGMDFDNHRPRSQIRLNRRRGVAQAKLLFRGEVVPNTLTFEARIVGDLNDAEERLLDQGVRLLTHLGSQKSRGLGHCHLSWISEE